MVDGIVAQISDLTGLFPAPELFLRLDSTTPSSESRCHPALVVNIASIYSTWRIGIEECMCPFGLLEKLLCSPQCPNEEEPRHLADEQGDYTKRDELAGEFGHRHGEHHAARPGFELSSARVPPVSTPGPKPFYDVLWSESGPIHV